MLLSADLIPNKLPACLGVSLEASRVSLARFRNLRVVFGPSFAGELSFVAGSELQGSALDGWTLVWEPSAPEE